ncbi:MAG: hypothetical protein K6E74_02065 [Bacilli bacterium]|nr:hypothetical protein [Bacilli bacterium]
MKIYGLYDKVSEKYLSITMCESAQMFVRSCFATILMDYPLKDIEFYCLGQIDSDLGIIKPCAPKLEDWECYKFPETRAEKLKFLTSEQIEEFAKKKKHEFLEKTKDQIKDYEKLLINAKGELHKEEHIDKPDKSKIKLLKKTIKDISIHIQKLKEVQ